MALDLADVPVLVTGGAGFIGSHLVDALVERGARVRVLDDLSTGRRENLAQLGARVELVEGDIRDVAVCRRAVEGVRYVFHQAALGSVPRSMEDPATTIDINVGGTTNVFAAARDAKVARLVYASSSSVYGDSETLPKREGDEGRLLSPYAYSKQANEDLADVFARCFGMELVGLRYFNVYGPRQDPEGPYAAVVPRFFAAALRGEAPVIYGDGEQSRDFTWVGDAVGANLAAAAAPREACGRAYNVGAGGATTVRELAAAIRAATGSSAEPRFEPERPGDIRHSLADTRALQDATGFVPSMPVREGIARSAAYYRELFRSG